MSDTLWNHDEPVRDLGIEVPRWIDQDISGADVAAIIQGGCASGAYMPAVTYHEALATMAEHGDDVMQFLDEQDAGDVLSLPSLLQHSWSGVCVYFLSAAVELWAASVEDEVRERLEGDA